jgi:hypothetical protein
MLVKIVRIKLVRMEQMQKMVHKMQLKRAGLQMLLLPLPEPSLKLCLVRDQAVVDLLHQLP